MHFPGNAVWQGFCAPSFRSALPKCKLLPNRWNPLRFSVQDAEQKLGGGAEAPTPPGIAQEVRGIGRKRLHRYFLHFPKIVANRWRVFLREPRGMG